MSKLKFQVIYDDKIYEFDEGLKAYLFHLAVRYEHDQKHGIKELLRYVDLVSDCIYTDINSTIIADFASYVTLHWQKVKNMDRYELLDFYYDNTN